MSKRIRSTSKQHRSSKSPEPTIAGLAEPPPDLASYIRGLYGRVARKLGVDPSYVSRVARDERESKEVEGELRRQLDAIVKYLGRRRPGKRSKVVRKSPVRNRASRAVRTKRR